MEKVLCKSVGVVSRMGLPWARPALLMRIVGARPPKSLVMAAALAWMAV